MLDPSEITDFWLNEVGQDRWFNADAALDAEIHSRFSDAWQAARDGKYVEWRTRPENLLPFLILVDQFPRNMFRGTPKAYATDKIALCAAKKAVDCLWDMRISEPERQFFYLPLMHSENLNDQNRCLRLIKSRMPERCDALYPHAKAHREVIRKFGRFPYRNPPLERRDTGLETAFLDAGGYKTVFQDIQGQ